jgi:uncharacterized membrane protein
MIEIRITSEDCNLKLILFYLLVFSISSQEKKTNNKEATKNTKQAEVIPKESAKSERSVDKLREGLKKREFGRFGDKRF